MRRVKITLTRGVKLTDRNAAVGIGSLIMFIAMLIVAGIAASVMIQTMNSLQEQALKTSRDTLKDISSGLKVSQVNGYYDGSTISQIALFVSITAGSDEIDLAYAYVSLSDSSKKVVLAYDSTTYSSTVSNGLFETLNSSNLTSVEFGIMKVRDIDSSCSASNPVINNDDLVVLLLNTTSCFSGIGTRTDVSGNIVPEFGMSGVIGFTTPGSYFDTVIELQ